MHRPKLSNLITQPRAQCSPPKMCHRASAASWSRDVQAAGTHERHRVGKLCRQSPGEAGDKALRLVRPREKPFAQFKELSGFTKVTPNVPVCGSRVLSRRGAGPGRPRPDLGLPMRPSPSRANNDMQRGPAGSRAPTLGRPGDERRGHRAGRSLRAILQLQTLSHL